MNTYKVPFRIDEGNIGGLNRVIGFTSHITNIRIYIIKGEEGRWRGSMVVSNRGCSQISSVRFFKDEHDAVLQSQGMLSIMAQNHRRLMPEYNITTFDKKFIDCSFNEIVEWFTKCGFFDVKRYHKIEVK